MYSLALRSALQLSLPLIISSFLHFYPISLWGNRIDSIYSSYFCPCHHCYLPSIYPAIPLLFHSFQLLSFHPYFLVLFFPLHPTLHSYLPLPFIPHHLIPLHLSIDNLAALCPLQPSQSDPVRGLMLWKMTVNGHFCCHHHRFGAACRLQPCCLATPQTASLQKAWAPVCSAAIETQA